MSNEKFDSHIRNKLREHVPDYDQQAWQQFQKLLPQPWYMQLLSTHAGWLFGGVASTALVASLIFYNLKTKTLNDKIITLENDTAAAQIDTVFVNQTVYDTVYITETLKEPKYIQGATQKERNDSGVGSKTLQKRNNASPEHTLEKGSIASSFDQNQSTVSTLEEPMAVIQEGKTETSENGNTSKANAKPKSKVNTPSKYKDVLASGESLNKNSLSISEISKSEPSVMVSDRAAPATSGQQTYIQSNKQTESKEAMVSDELSGQTAQSLASEVQTNDQAADIRNELPSEEIPLAIPTSIPETKVSVIDSILKKDTLLPIEVELLDELKKQAKDKKQFKFPVMRVGVESDLIGLRNLATGPTVEVFLGRKFSFNTGLMVAKLRVNNHSMLADYNKDTGKDFKNEFRMYGGFQENDPRPIKDISINTTLLKVPLYFNYYIDTWSRFNFIISAGTKLDISVYQDVKFKSGYLGDENWKRFEAKPTPKVFNNFFYGTGAQYKYKQVVAQMMPYFDFNFRNTGYSNNIGRVGLMGSIKYQIGK